MGQWFGPSRPPIVILGLDPRTPTGTRPLTLYGVLPHSR